MPRDDTAINTTTIETMPGIETHPDHEKLKRIERIADWLDTKFRIPVINYPVGLDGIIGLIPGVGDTVTTGVSGYLIYEAHKAGASKRLLARMSGNVALDWLYGLLPVVGDLIDFAHKANAKNAKLLADELRTKHARELAEGTVRRTAA